MRPVHYSAQSRCTAVKLDSAPSRILRRNRRGVKRPSETSAGAEVERRRATHTARRHTRPTRSDGSLGRVHGGPGRMRAQVLALVALGQVDRACQRAAGARKHGARRATGAATAGATARRIHATRRLYATRGAKRCRKAWGVARVSLRRRAAERERRCLEAARVPRLAAALALVHSLLRAKGAAVRWRVGARAWCELPALFGLPDEAAAERGLAAHRVAWRLLAHLVRLSVAVRARARARGGLVDGTVGTVADHGPARTGPHGGAVAERVARRQWRVVLNGRAPVRHARGHAAATWRCAIVARNLGAHVLRRGRRVGGHAHRFARRVCRGRHRGVRQRHVVDGLGHDYALDAASAAFTRFFTLNSAGWRADVRT
mmetsp:Transcript_70416/g.194883  ORF Transcript_70416/g.194883 Transcript_70416/m.194883 type:complete len:374 (+) Transcript_70416:135-1256(+)